MNSRSRTHILEEESRTQLRHIMPVEWVIRDKPIDYGVDCEIELFDKKGNPSGIVFWVQLKATDSSKDGTIRSVRITKDKLDQYGSYQLPVIFLRYSSKKKNFHFSWANKHVLLNSKSESKTVNIKFDETNVWDKETPSYIENYLVKLTEVKRGNIKFPLNFYVANKPLGIVQITKLRSTIEKRYDLIKINRQEETSCFSIYFDDDKITLSLMDELGASFNLNKKDINKIDISKLSDLIAIGSLLILGQAKKYDLFKQLFTSGELKKLIKGNSEVLKYLIPHLLNGDDIKIYLSFIFDCIQDATDYSIEAITSIILLMIRQSASDDTKNIIKEYLENLLDTSKQERSEKSIASHLFNLGNFHKEQGEYLKSISYLNQARKMDPDYMGMDYFLKDVGGVCFDSERFYMAREYYRKATEVNKTDQNIKALYGDALMFTGLYKSALSEFDFYLNNSNNNSSLFDECLLKYNCLKSLMSYDFPITQKRQRFKAIDLANPKNLKEGEDFKGKLHEAIELDLLCSLAWYNIGHEQLKNKELEDGFLSFLMCGLINRWDVSSWINCTILSFQLKSVTTLIKSIVNTAYNYCGEEYITELATHLNNSNLPNVDELIESVDSLIYAPRRTKVHFKLVEDNGAVNKITLVS